MFFFLFLFFSCHVSLLPYLEVYDSLLLIGLARLLFLLVYSWFCFTNTLFFSLLHTSGCQKRENLFFFFLMGRREGNLLFLRTIHT